MKRDIDSNYGKYYSARDAVHVYPVEFVVRAFLGNYPRLENRIENFDGKKILDLGFGDGRNMPLLYNLGFQVFGVEITRQICDAAVGRLGALSVPVEAKEGRNSSIPFDDEFFDHLLACHACYYVDEGDCFGDNIREISRVLKPGGRFTFSLPNRSSYIFEGAEDKGDGHMVIRNDPYGIRNGYVLKAFSDPEEIEDSMSPLFEDFRIGSCCNDFWGIEEHVWIVVCRKK